MKDAKCAESNEITNFRFFRFYFWVMVIFGYFFTKNCQFSMDFHDSSKNEIRKYWNIYFSFVSAHCTSFMKVGSKLRSGGVCLSLLETEPVFYLTQKSQSRKCAPYCLNAALYRHVNSETSSRGGSTYDQFGPSISTRNIQQDKRSHCAVKNNENKKLGY